MKTYQEILVDVAEKEMKHVNFTEANIRMMAAKEYAKQWVVIAVALAGIDRGVERNELTVRLLESKIDAQ